MSRGAGRIERQISAVLAADPDNGFTVEDLCDRIYGEAAKRHRVAVLRAVKTLVARSSEVGTYRSGDGRVVVFNRFSLDSYAMARAKVHPRAQYRLIRKYRSSSLSVNEQEAALAAELRVGGMFHNCIVDGGPWWRDVELARAERDGDHQTALRLRAEIEAAEGARLEAFRALIEGAVR